MKDTGYSVTYAEGITPEMYEHHQKAIDKEGYHSFGVDGTCSCKGNPYVAKVIQASRAPICPECRSGKHRNCDGSALDERADDIVECRCPPAFHPEKRSSK